MQHPYQRRSEGSPRLPEVEPGRVHHGCSQRNRCDHRCWRRQNVGSQQNQYTSECDLFNEWMANGLRTRNTVVGKHGDHPSTHHRDDEQDDIESNLQTRPFGPGQHSEPGKMHGQNGCAKKHQQRDEEVVAPITALHQRDDQPDPDRYRKCDVHQGCRGHVGRQHQDSSGGPEQGKGKQHAAGRRRLSGPVTAGREEEPGDYRQRIPEQHLMAVPSRAVHQTDRQVSRVLGHPKRNRQRGEDTGKQIERPKTQGPERKFSSRCVSLRARFRD
ncbi:MAG: hypothetical protein CAPSK01_000450 [Candidatus Accumulibacter vicinus]|uniref:Uncharacterized protein n=1 Tax=Candidatus Accumulibacter vicinus TaxID=2954382 RepID=A0A084Y5Q7_9PROT|nr:MAG: hypothetical protein CAPSK01_000450 [Candidatus Accumulibacter vicinus]